MNFKYLFMHFGYKLLIFAFTPIWSLLEIPRKLTSVFRGKLTTKS